jgi:hypothetical protein
MPEGLRESMKLLQRLLNLSQFTFIAKREFSSQDLNPSLKRGEGEIFWVE